MATIEIPTRTEICVGIVGEQTDHDGKILSGGEVQILLSDLVVTEKTDDLSFVSNPNEFEASIPLKTEEQEAPEPLSLDGEEKSMMPDMETDEKQDDLDIELTEVPENQVKKWTTKVKILCNNIQEGCDTELWHIQVLMSAKRNKN